MWVCMCFGLYCLSNPIPFYKDLFDESYLMIEAQGIVCCGLLSLWGGDGELLPGGCTAISRRVSIDRFL